MRTTKYRTGSDSDRVERKRGNEVTTGSDRDQLKAKLEWDEKYRTGSDSDRLKQRKPRHSSQWDRINLNSRRAALRLSLDRPGSV